MVEIWTPVRVRWWGSLSGRSLRGSGHRSKYWIKIPSPWLFEQQKDRREEGDGSSTPWSLVLGPWCLVPASSLTAAQAADSFSFSFSFWSPSGFYRVGRCTFHVATEPTAGTNNYSRQEKEQQYRILVDSKLS